MCCRPGTQIGLCQSPDCHRSQEQSLVAALLSSFRVITLQPRPAGPASILSSPSSPSSIDPLCSLSPPAACHSLMTVFPRVVAPVRAVSSLSSGFKLTLPVRHFLSGTSCLHRGLQAPDSWGRVVAVWRPLAEAAYPYSYRSSCSCIAFVFVSLHP